MISVVLLHDVIGKGSSTKMLEFLLVIVMPILSADVKKERVGESYNGQFSHYGKCSCTIRPLLFCAKA